MDMSRLDITEQDADTAGTGLFRLDPGDVLTAAQAGELLDPYIKPLPRFDDSLLPS